MYSYRDDLIWTLFYGDRGSVNNELNGAVAIEIAVLPAALNGTRMQAIITRVSGFYFWSAVLNLSSLYTGSRGVMALDIFTSFC